MIAVLMLTELSFEFPSFVGNGRDDSFVGPEDVGSNDREFVGSADNDGFPIEESLGGARFVLLSTIFISMELNSGLFSDVVLFEKRE